MKDRSEGLLAADFFVFRTPLLPFDTFAAWGAELEAPQASDDAALERAIASDRRKLRAELRKIVAKAEVREAIYLASPSLVESIAIWIEDPDCERGRKVEKSLVKYLARMSGRATPLGLLAGVSTGRTAGESALRIVARSEYRRHTRLDFHYLGALAFNLFHDPVFCLDVPVRPNSSLHRTGNCLRFLALQQQGERRNFHFIVAESNVHIDRALRLTAATAVTPRKLAAALADDAAEISEDEAANLVAQLLDVQLLVSELDPPVTGSGALEDLMRQLAPHPGAGDLRRRLLEVGAALAELDRLPVGTVSAERYGAIAATLEGLPAPLEPGKLYQVDLFKPAIDATLGEPVVKELVRGVMALRRMSVPADPLQAFRTLFRERYEENPQDVPLQELLDSELGLFAKGSAGNSEGNLLDDIDLQESEPPAPVSFTNADQYRLRLLTTALAAGAREITLTDTDIERLAAPSPAPLPDSLVVHATLGAPAAQALQAENFRLCILNAAGPSGGNLLGRFCHGDEALAAGVHQLLTAEEALQPDAIFAEVVHLPATERWGNFLQRPLLRRHEIPYLGRSAAPPECQIAVSDLTVSLVGNRVVLRSRSRGKEVLPRLTNAHNFTHPNNDKLYRFLCSLAQQGVTGWLRWQWGVLQTAPFLPRVVHGKVILSLATWNLGKEELLRLAKSADGALIQAVKDLRARHRLPRFVLFSATQAGDNWLPIDLDNLLSIEAWAQLLSASESGVLYEMFPAPDELVAEGPEGHFVSELLVPFTVVRPPAPAPAPPPAFQGSDRTSQAVRTFSAGSEWLYAKVYLTSTAADDLLKELGPAFARLLKAGAMDGFFFVRYGDPFWHLRLRVHGDPERLRSEVLPAISQASQRLIEDGVAWRFQLDTYRREIERYGGDAGIELCERIFCADSAAVSAIVSDLTGEELPDVRWQLALPGMALLMDDLGLRLDERLETLETLASAFRQEFLGTPNLERSLGRKHRALAKRVDALLRGAAQDAETEGEVPWPLLRHFQTRSQAIKPLGDALRQGQARGALTRSLTDIAGSLLHMHVNRLLRAHQRPHEVVLYELLLRNYRSRKALAGKT